VGVVAVRRRGRRRRRRRGAVVRRISSPSDSSVSSSVPAIAVAVVVDAFQPQIVPPFFSSPPFRRRARGGRGRIPGRRDDDGVGIQFSFFQQGRDGGFVPRNVDVVLLQPAGYPVVVDDVDRRGPSRHGKRTPVARYRRVVAVGIAGHKL